MAKKTRRLLVQMINSSSHIEMVEVRCEVFEERDGFYADLGMVESEARISMAEHFNVGRDGSAVRDYDFVGALCAKLEGLERGRITWVKDKT